MLAPGPVRYVQRKMSALLSATDLGLYRGERRLFGPLQFALQAGEMLLIEGANGSGKTSLLRVIAGLLEADAGEIHWHGTDTRRIRQKFAAELVWYGHRSGCKQDLSLLENLACEAALRPQSLMPLEQVLERLGLSRLVALPMRALSAGQQRRVALARLLLCSASLWLLDEPYTNLDREGQALVDELLSAHLANGGVAVVASHHGINTAARQHRLLLQ